MPVKIRHDIPDSQGRDPEERLWFTVGSEGRFLGGFELWEDRRGGHTMLIPILRDGRRSSAQVLLPGDTEKLRDIGQVFIDFADKVDAANFDY